MFFVQVGLMCNPPQPGDPSYEQYAAESKGVLEGLGRKARALSEGFNKFKNMQCNEVEGEGAVSYSGLSF